MVQLDSPLRSLSLPWADFNELDEMIIYSQDTRLSELDWPLPFRDLALINENHDLVGWVPFSRLYEEVVNLWQLTSNLYQTLLQTVDDAVTVIDRNGHVISWNNSAEQLYNCSKEQIIGKPITDFFKEESLMLMSTIQNGTSIRHQYNQSSSDVHVLVSTMPLSRNGELVGGISVERNINDLVKLNEGLADKTAYIQDLEQKIETLNASDPFYKIKGRSKALIESIKLAKRVASTDASVLIAGESGVGKELFAQALHKASARTTEPFVDLNCGAIPASLFESELFGYEKGAFTGATKEGKKGKFDLAKGGTLFLDEIGEMPLDLQVKLLRVLQEKKFYRVGGNTPIPFDVRIISATNRNLEEMVASGTFRQDLYYRLNVVSIQIPSLRERIEDIPELVQLFITEFSNKYHRPIPYIDPEVMLTFLNNPWHGNIRQLRNTIEHMIILADEGGIFPGHIPQSLNGNQLVQRSHSNSSQSPLKITGTPHYSESAGDTDLEALQMALEKTYGNKSAAAKLLGISRVTLYNKIKKYGLS